MIIPVGMLLIAGCTSSSHIPESPAGNAVVPTVSSSTTTISTSDATAVPVECSQESDTSFTILPGDPFTYRGSVPSGKISEMRIWMFGKNSITVNTIPAQQYKPFIFKLTSDQTSRMINGTYRVLFESPLSEGSFDMKIGYVGIQNNPVLYDRTGNRIFSFLDITDNHLNGLDAADTVEQAIRNNGTENVSRITLVVKNPEIIINPVPHHYVGDTITFDGTTNLPPGEMIVLGVYSIDFTMCPKMQCSESVHYCCGGIQTTIAVIPGNCDINTWSWDVNTSQHGFQPDHHYAVSASGRERLVENTSVFTVSGIPQPNISLNLPENDPNEYAIRLSGQVNTGNGPNEKLLLMISSDSGKKESYTIPVTLNGTGYYWNYTLKKSAITPFNFYTVNITSIYNPKIGIRRTFYYNNEPSFYPYNPYSP
jgi:hypothetical protein